MTNIISWVVFVALLVHVLKYALILWFNNDNEKE